MPTDDRTLAQNEIQVRLKEANEESQRLREENDRLRAMLGINHSTPSQNAPQRNLDPKSSTLALSELYTPERKIALFRNLFRGREDVFAIRWEGKGGKSGYSPAGVIYSGTTKPLIVDVQITACGDSKYELEACHGCAVGST